MSLANQEQMRPQVQPSPFPNPSQTLTRAVHSIPTTTTLLSFTDRLLITISQAGKLTHWVHVPLASSASSSSIDPSWTSNHAASAAFDGVDPDAPNASLLPRRELTATTILGGTRRDEEVFGQMLGTVIASAVLTKRPDERRLLVLGVGFVDVAAMGTSREAFDEVVGLVLDCL